MLFFASLRRHIARRALALCLLCTGAVACTLQAKPITMEDKIMHVTLQRTGGFAGIPLIKSIDAASLSASEITALQQMIETAHFFELPALIPSKPQPDRFEYQIIIEADGNKHSVTAAEQALPAELKPLVDWLIRLGRSAR